MTKADSTKASAPANVEAQAQGEGAKALSVEALASRLNVTPKDVRRWLRSQAKAAQAQDTLPGKGGRYAFTEAQAEALIGLYGRTKAAKGTHAPGAAIIAALTHADVEAGKGAL